MIEMLMFCYFITIESGQGCFTNIILTLDSKFSNYTLSPILLKGSSLIYFRMDIFQV